MKKISSLFLLLLVSGSFVYGQKENNNWAFSTNIGISFNTGVPVFFPGVAINKSSQEGTSTISDSLGNLLFYTDGGSVWNKNHAIMTNGTGLYGSYTASQAALIVQEPGGHTIYYIFTQDASTGALGMNYSVVDLSQSGGLGSVTQKNIRLNGTTLYTEKLTGILHSNNKDVWVIGHEKGTTAFNAYLVTSAGVNTTPVISQGGQITDDVGMMRNSLDGTRLALADWNALAGFEVLDFDRSTGMVSNPIFIQGYQYAYSVAFSPSGRYLYGGCYNSKMLYQFDLQATSITGQLIATTATPFGDMQIGPDSLIYAAIRSSTHMGTIYQPDQPGTACNFVETAFNLQGKISQLCLSNYVYPAGGPQLAPLSSFSASPTTICEGICVPFTNLSVNAKSYQWSFPGGSPSASTVANPTVCYASSGKYNVQLIAINGSLQDTTIITQYITVTQGPQAGTLSSSADSICEGTGITTTLSTSGSSGNLQWQESLNGVSFANISSATATSYTTPPTITQTTYYRLVASMGSCPPDTSTVVAFHILPSPVANFSHTVSGTQVTFNSAGTSGDVTSYSWDFGDGGTSTQANPVHPYAVKDTFSVCLTVYNGSNCSFTLCKDVIVQEGAGVGDARPSLFVKIYPNPAGGVINLLTEGLMGRYDLKVYNTLGQLVLVDDLTIQQGITSIDVSHLAAGSYHLVLGSDSDFLSGRFVRLE